MVTLIVRARRMSDKGALLKANIWINDYITSYQIVQHGCKEILTAKNTPFQELMVVDLCVYGKALVLDGKIQCTVGDEKLYHEPLCHVPLILHTMSNHKRESLRHSIEVNGREQKGHLRHEVPR